MAGLGREEVTAAWRRSTMQVAARGAGATARRSHSLFTPEEGDFSDARKFSTSVKSRDVRSS